MQELRPRDYAAAILSEKERDERVRMLGNVPEHLREWVKGLVEDAYKYSAKRRQAAEQAKEQRRRKA